MKVLVAATSKHGATEETARAIGDVLAERGLEVTMAPMADVGSSRTVLVTVRGDR